jgi:hypothetical protein
MAGKSSVLVITTSPQGNPSIVTPCGRGSVPVPLHSGHWICAWVCDIRINSRITMALARLRVTTNLQRYAHAPCGQCGSFCVCCYFARSFRTECSPSARITRCHTYGRALINTSVTASADLGARSRRSSSIRVRIVVKSSAERGGPRAAVLPYVRGSLRNHRRHGWGSCCVPWIGLAQADRSSGSVQPGNVGAASAE